MYIIMVLDMHVKFAKQFTHYLILLESNKKNLKMGTVVLKNQKKTPKITTATTTGREAMWFYIHKL